MLKQKNQMKNSTERSKLLVIGGGSFGTCVAHMIAQAGHPMKLWVRRPELAEEINSQHRSETYLHGFKLDKKLHATSEMEGAVREAKLIFVAVPSLYFRGVAQQLGDFLEGDQYVVHVVKGIELKTAARMSQVLREETCALKIGALAGPNLAVEIMQGAPAGAVIASKYEGLISEVQQIFAKTHFRVYGSNDIIGVEFASAFKNILALVLGAADGLGFGMNSKALLLTRGLEQMTRMGIALGAQAETFIGLAGVGDLVATALSPLSRNHQVGRRLALGEKLDEIIHSMKHVAEGVSTAPVLAQQAEELGLELALLNGVNEVLKQKKSIKKAMAELISRPTGKEYSLD